VRTSGVDQLRDILAPRTVAVIGASESAAKFGGRVMHFLLKHRYRGTILPIHPTAGAILGIRAWRSVAEAPGPIDVALLAAPRVHIPDAVAQCAAAGVKGCVIITADFAEVGEEGARREAELVASARRHGMRIIGPNCLGFVNTTLDLALTSSVALAVEPLPRGPIGLVSQSGSLMAAQVSHALDLGTGFTLCVTVGNEADVDACDVIEFLVEDPPTRAVCAYLEGIRDGRRFLVLADRARAAGKPLLVVKSGRTDAGRRVALSHTASLAGAWDVLEAACREHAVILLDDPEAMIMTADLLIRYGAPRSDGVGLLCASGGTLAVSADRIGAAGLRFSEPGATTRAKLAGRIPPSRPLNPLDLGGLARERAVSDGTAIFDAFAEDPEVGAIALVVATGPQLDERVREWGARATHHGKPTVITLTPGSLVDGARRTLREMRVPFVNRLDDGVRVLAGAIAWGEALRLPVVPPVRPPGCMAADAIAPGTTGLLTEPETKRLLAVAGIRVTREAVATSVEDAVRAAADTGFPVVLKAVARGLVHKSDIGAVQLGLADAAAVAAAWKTIRDAVDRHAPTAAFEGCVVQELAAGGIELILGAQYDPVFGPVVLVGGGGVQVELAKDVALGIAPVSTVTAHRMLDRLRIRPLLAGYRGRAAGDVDAIADAIVRLSWLAHDLGPRLAELDVNPLLARPPGEGVIALDARATLRNARSP
jgi:acetyl-CoA synthetase (ADP-forming)